MSRFLLMGAVAVGFGTVAIAADAGAERSGIPVRVQAEDCATTGTIVGPGTTLFTPESEASGRRFVVLPPGAELELRVPIHADSIVLRVSYPDAPQGGGEDGTLELRMGETVLHLPVTSRNNWAYGRGRFNSPDVWWQDPAQGRPRYMWDEAAMRLPDLPAGTRLTARNPHATATVRIDFAEFELLPPVVVPPAGALSFADWKPDATGVADCTALLQAAVDAAQQQKRPLYLPEGTYRIACVRLPGGQLQGAGLWRTRFVGPLSRFHFSGGTATMADLAVFGSTAHRNDHTDDDNAFSGVPGPGTRLERIWVEHKKCAWWISPAGEGRVVEDLTISGWRIRDTLADGINFYNGARRCVVEDCLVRNTGDDGLASWSPAGRGKPSGEIAFRRNQVELPWLASGIAVYGGGPFTIVGNTIADTVTTGSGIYISASFKAWPFSGKVEVDDNVLLRCGAHESDPGGPTGAIRLTAIDEDMTSAQFALTNNQVVAPLESAVSLQGPRRIGNLTITGLKLADAGSAVLLDVRPNARGEATIADAINPAAALWRIAPEALFTIWRTEGGVATRLGAAPAAAP
jgi:hypothetical protein